MTPIRILLAEDDAHIRAGLVDTLESEGYQVIEAGDGQQALDLFEREPVDFALLDIMMPEKSGYDVCREIRARNRTLPIIMLTAKGEEIDKVVGLQLGADDYVTKPFGVHELLARIAAVLRRSVSHRSESHRSVNRLANQDNSGKEGQGHVGQAIAGETLFDFGGYKVDTKQFRLLNNRGGINLSQRELRLIRYFHSHPNEVLSRDRILNRIWGVDYPGTTRTLDQHIANLRKKIEKDPANPRIITTVHGVGYRYGPL